MHNHATDPSIAMHGLVRILFVLCVVTVLEKHTVGSCLFQRQAENCSFKLHSGHSMRRGAGRVNPDGRKQLPLSLGFKCAHCGGEFGSRSGMDSHRRHRNSIGTLCADPMNSKSMSFTERADHSAGILRQHDTLGVQHKQASFLLSHYDSHTHFATLRNNAIMDIMNIIDIMN